MTAFKKTFTKRTGTGAPRAGTRASYDASRGKTFAPKARFGGREDITKREGFKTHFTATCSSCGASCEVPFKPVNGKPVYCRNCFVPSDDRAASRAPRAMARDARPAPAADAALNASILKQLEILNAKMERVIALLGERSGEER